MADVDATSGEMSGGLTGNSGYFSYQILTGININGEDHNVFRMYANRSLMDSESGLTHEVLQSDGSAANPKGFSTGDGSGLYWYGGVPQNSGTPPSQFITGLIPDGKYSTFVTIGYGLSDLTTPDLVTIGDLVWGTDGLDMNTALGGSWGHLPGSQNLGFVDSDSATMGNGQTLMLQITTTSESIDYDLNIKTRADGSGYTWESAGTIAVPAPGALALLGIAGLASRRRRRA